MSAPRLLTLTLEELEPQLLVPVPFEWSALTRTLGTAEARRVLQLAVGHLHDVSLRAVVVWSGDLLVHVSVRDREVVAA